MREPQGGSGVLIRVSYIRIHVNGYTATSDMPHYNQVCPSAVPQQYGWQSLLTLLFLKAPPLVRGQGNFGHRLFPENLPTAPTNRPVEGCQAWKTRLLTVAFGSC